MATEFTLTPAFVAPAAPSQRPQLRGIQISGHAGPLDSSKISAAPSTIPCVASALTVVGASAVAVSAKKRASTRAAAEAVACRAFDPSSQPGVTAPFGFFDPIGISKNIDEKEFKRLRSCEIRHARAAMMGAAGLLAQGYYKLPYYENVPSGLAAQWTEPGSNSLCLIFGLIGCLELGLGPWKEDPEKPGDYGNPMYGDGEVSLDMQNKELNNGRFAMFAVMGIISAEIYTGSEAVQQFAVPRTASISTSTRHGFCGASLATSARALHSSRRAFDLASQAGASAPLGAFDPLKCSSSQERFDKFRSSEIKHGRVAMMAILGSIFQHWSHDAITPTEVFHDVPSGMAGFMSDSGSKGIWTLITCAGFLELGPWADEFAKSPGDFGDPCGLALDYASTPEELKSMKTKELNNGRLAMMATMGMIAAECVTKEEITDLPKQLCF
eukprot:TRINITY_DN268_c0_g2_i1.p1 TRINITY_DN268_c0_g2~~TRINITY_DN268_c0_g2_i1.p1  ORF type:complete len:441 (+),score=102.62 TRINITY_DN268_c0_g2_i1:73-1395(+)